MLKYIIKRLLAGVLTMVVLITVAFFMMHAMPGGPFSPSEEKNVPKEVLERIAASYGLDQPVWKQYLNYWNNLLHGTLPVFYGLRNSIFVSVCSAILCVYFSTMTAYAIHAYEFKLKKFMFTFILMIMMIPTQVTVLGFLQLIGKMKLDDSFIPLIVPAIAAPVSFFYMKQYMDSVLSLSLVEAARIDGAGEFRTFNSIVLPLMRPAIAVQAIFTFVSSWNNYFTPALVLHTDKKKTLPILIAQLRSADWLKFDMGQVYVMIAFSIFPVIVVYLLLSRNIVGGVTAGGVKE